MDSDEYKIYGNLRGDFLPQFIGWDDGEYPILVLEDLSKGFWPSPWSSERISRVRDTLEKVFAAIPSPGLPLSETLTEMLGWQEVSKDPSGFLSLKLASKEWLNKALPVLVEAENSVNLKGNALVHTDVRSDNICFFEDRTLLIDWNWATVGNPKIDFITWLPSLHSEGGPAPWSFTIEEPELISFIAGYFASQAYRPPHKQGPMIRQLQLAQLKSALPWAARALDLPLPEHDDSVSIPVRFK